LKASYLLEKGLMETREIPPPELEDDKVLVNIKSVGICGSDLHYYQHGKIDKFVVEEPLILGHEASGVVHKVGNNVSKFSIGDRVAIEPGVPCGRCQYCRQGDYNLCPDMVFMATPPIDGAFQEIISHHPDFLFPLPENVSFEAGALVEPLAIALNIYQKANFSLGDRVLILGAGTVGQLTIQAFKDAGAEMIVATDIDDYSLEVALKSGADIAIHSKELSNKYDDYFDIVIEAAGVQETLLQTTSYVKPGGSVVLVGMAPESIMEYEIGKILNKELTIRGIFRYANEYPRGINMLKKGSIDFEPIITERYAFSEIEKAFSTLTDNPKNHIKAMVNFA